MPLSFEREVIFVRAVDNTFPVILSLMEVCIIHWSYTSHYDGVIYAHNNFQFYFCNL